MHPLVERVAHSVLILQSPTGQHLCQQSEVGWYSYLFTTPCIRHSQGLREASLLRRLDRAMVIQARDDQLRECICSDRKVHTSRVSSGIHRTIAGRRLESVHGE